MIPAIVCSYGSLNHLSFLIERKNHYLLSVLTFEDLRKIWADLIIDSKEMYHNFKQCNTYNMEIFKERLDEEIEKKVNLHHIP